MESAKPNTPLFWGTVIAVVAADLVTKLIAAAMLAPQHIPHEILGNHLRLTLVYNPGAAFGLNLGIWQAHASKTAGFSYLDPIVLATLFAWIIFGVIGLSRWVRFLSGRNAALTAICGLGLLVFTLVVSLVPGLSFHRFQ